MYDESDLSLFPRGRWRLPVGGEPEWIAYSRTERVVNALRDTIGFACRVVGALLFAVVLGMFPMGVVYAFGILLFGHDGHNVGLFAAGMVYAYALSDAWKEI